ncbi:hypothetical protein [Cupriavidus pampae]|uniref:EamA family transporter n=1 Tax=Cupriavidus pampae TaxID=659251 RepID=A0ABN7ZHR8_9BURK|nr:hypothetical protein [Cupriavidus pampae]CAG9183826.1 hypothetical protein LMG32289_05433 [Cupriavidus pampae]
MDISTTTGAGGLLVAGNLAIWVVSIVANSPNFDVQPGFAVFRWISVGLTLLCGLGGLGLMRRE